MEIVEPTSQFGFELALRAAQFAVAAIVGFAAVQFYLWQQRTKKVEAYIGAVDKYHNLNRLVIGDADLQAIEVQNHFVVEGLSRDDVKKMFYYFELLNGIGGVLENRHGKLSPPKSDKGLFYVSTIMNVAKCTYHDRGFIKQHCLPRGYTREFADFMEELWTEAEVDLRNNGFLPRPLLSQSIPQRAKVSN